MSVILKHPLDTPPLLSLSILKLIGRTDVRVQSGKAVTETELIFFPKGDAIHTDANIARYFARTTPELRLYDGDADALGQIDDWMYWSTLTSDDEKVWIERLTALNQHLALRTYIVGHTLSLADAAAFHSVEQSTVARAIFESKKGKSFGHVKRWSDHLRAQDAFGGQLVKKKKGVFTKSGAMGSLAKITVSGARGTVVTRFPPEPSGYMHIGHVKAAMLNDHYARSNGGRLHLRFDDTNPAAEKAEFEDAIIGDLALVGIKPDTVSHTSDFFGKFVEYMTQMITNGDAYVDTTPKEEASEQRMNKKPCPCRDQTVEKNLELWEEMIKGTDLGRTCVVRAKMKYDDDNSALRDPAMYRCKPEPHHRTGTRFKVYPLYDFACPIIDSLEGITHALRSNEYMLRNPLYDWVCIKLGLRVPKIQDFSRLNFEYVLLSKRKLQRLVTAGFVSGWDDPRFPTIRGILRLGMEPPVLREFILAQGASKCSILMTMEKLWVLNKKYVDKIAHRFVAIPAKGRVPLTLTGVEQPRSVMSVQLHPKDASLGTHSRLYADTLWLDVADALLLKEGEEFTLKSWGNAVVTSIKVEDGVPVAIEAKLHLAGDFKTTALKATWVPRIGAGVPHNDEGHLVDVLVQEYDYLIKVKKMDQYDDLDNVLNTKSKIEYQAFGEPSLRLVNKGQKIQLERIGYFICDRAVSDDAPMVLIKIPDGKSKLVAELEAAAKK
mmetsp:Transcript_16401/g.28149  ORF Transcript_16401/g.28149 Transcript_16401/m.28149 type:complete len:720 (+) Transcript_16401:50-2209(+)